MLLVQEIDQLLEIHVISLAGGSETHQISTPIGWSSISHLHGPEQFLDVVSRTDLLIEHVKLVEREVAGFDRVVLAAGQLHFGEELIDQSLGATGGERTGDHFYRNFTSGIHREVQTHPTIDIRGTRLILCVCTVESTVERTK